MRRVGLVSLSVGVTLALGGAWGCADSPASGALGPAAARVDPLSTTKVTVCHVGGRASEPRFTPITLAPSGALAHIAADGTPRTGHELDYYATEQTPCPPPETPQGDLVICKVAGTGITPGTPASFTVTSVADPITVASGPAPAGTCSAPIALATGVVRVTETLPPNTTTSLIPDVTPTGALLGGGGTLTTTFADVQVFAGQTTTITFTNLASP